MGGGKRRLVKNQRTRSNKSPFVAAGVLLDFQINSSDSPPSNPGKSPNDGAKSTRSRASRSNGCASANRARKSSSNPFDYAYPTVDLQEVSCSASHVLSDSTPLVLVDSNETRIVGYVDRMPCSEPAVGETFTYDYGSSSVIGEGCHQGLGFCDKEADEEVEADGEEGDMQGIILPPVETKTCTPKRACNKGKSMAEGSPPRKNGGFLSIGGVKLYTEDMVFSDEEDNGETEGDLVDSGSSVSDEMSCSESSGLSDSDGSDDDEESDSGSDIDDDVAEDYLDGIGGGSELLNAEWLLGRDLEEEDSSSSSADSDESLEKLGGTELEIASREYGMKIPKSRKKHSPNQHKELPTMNNGPLALDDLFLVKDPRTASGKKKYVPRLAQSWPREKMKKSKNAPGEKKKHRKELIAIKRRERMLRRGVDLEQINLKLKQMVLDEVDMLSFQPMHSRDCSQVQRLASIYRLRSGCQGSGKKRFVTVTRTGHTCMPSASDKLRLEKLLCAGDEYADFVISQDWNTKTPAREKKRSKMAAKLSGSRASSHRRTELHQSPKLIRNSSTLGRSEGSRKTQGGRRTRTFADQPVSFVSSGIMEVDLVEETVMVDLSENDATCEMKPVSSSARLGAYEMHTKGFGSKMLSKMGFVEGSGLGKDGQGMAEPIEAVKRPKSIGLGIEFCEAADSEGNGARKRSEKQAFEKHKKAAGSKVAKTGFVESTMTSSSRRGESERIGTFEKHTKGFGSRMMAKMGFVEGTGLGKDAQGITKPLAAVKLPKSRGLGAKG